MGRLDPKKQSTDELLTWIAEDCGNDPARREILRRLRQEGPERPEGGVGSPPTAKAALDKAIQEARKRADKTVQVSEAFLRRLRTGREERDDG